MLQAPSSSEPTEKASASTSSDGGGIQAEAMVTVAAEGAGLGPAERGLYARSGEGESDRPPSRRAAWAKRRSGETGRLTVFLPCLAVATGAGSAWSLRMSSDCSL